MVSKGFSICRSCSLAILGLAPMAVGALALAGLMTGTASATTVIYQDTFSGSSSAELNGATPTVDNGTSTTWTADPQWMQDGSVVAYNNDSVNGDDNAFLKFTPVSGFIYTLSEGVDVTSTGNPYAGAGIGFLPTDILQSNLTTQAGPSLSAGEPGSGGNEITAYAGPGATNGSADSYQGAGVQNLQIVLNTASSTWTVQFLDNGVAEQPIFAYTTNPTIAYVGFGTQGTNAQMSNFELTSSPVPEPASLGLLAVGGLGLLLLKRRKIA